ncbi:helix-turn-helix transcriptional regulator [Amycolatopsis orientalis]|uniref:Helix-turn-helix transcriptional regulator n=1 Tax=Amycolatopsis orientalis TaxID=31958 RepID=A0A193BUB5_AMYOR|nr:LuxR C-terminal-related transcriptional regulator [Amycolatopsis orientalis]ANN15775.1 helix-turn-helix transcriptional regulator [Amycolatopsis orientalis]
MDPLSVLGQVEYMLAAPRPELLPRFSETAAAVLPHRAAAMETGDCSRLPVKVHGDPEITGLVTSAELRGLAAFGVPGQAVVADGTLGGKRRKLVVLTSAPVIGKGAMIALVPDGDDIEGGALEFVAKLWDIVSVNAAQRATDPEPAVLESNIAAATARARAITDLGQTHATTLASLLSVLRSRRLDDAVARRTATDLAAAALVELRSTADRDQELSAEPASSAFDTLAAQLDPLVRHNDVTVDLAGPGDERPLPQDIAHTARTVTRGLVLTALERESTRVRASWRLDGQTLRITVRDDGQDVADAVPATGLTERITPLGGRWEIDAVPGWGATITAVLPLGVQETPDLRPLDRLNPRELEVLAGIARGKRNRQIAEELMLTEHTVKFHVRKILGKLEVTSRGEAAILARELRLESVGA